MKMAEANIERVRNGQTAQGFYVVGPDGSFYAYNNNRSVERVLGVMDTALTQYNLRPPKKVSIPASQAKSTQPWQLPSGASILRTHSRIIPVPSGAAQSNNRVARDHLWILKEELQTIYDKCFGTASFEMPKTLASRIIRFHLVDNIRGEPVFWDGPEIKKAAIRVFPKPGDRNTFTLTGDFEMQTAGNERGMSGKIEGEMTLDPKTMRIVRSRVLADATAWGAGPYTPNPPAGKFALKIAFVDVEDSISKIVAPQGTNWGDSYFRSTL